MHIDDFFNDASSADYSDVELQIADQQLLSEIKIWVDSGAAVPTLENQSVFDFMAKLYPVGLNRIEWNDVQPHNCVDVLPFVDRQTVRQQDEAVRVEAQRTTVVEWLSGVVPHTDEKVLWVGDGGDLAVCLEISAFYDAYPILFLSGQHSYVLPRDGSWCLNYTIESQLFFGFAEDSKGGGGAPSG